MELKVETDPVLSKVREELEQLRFGLGAAGINAGLVAGVQPIRRAIKEEAPRDSGALAASIGYRKLSKRQRSRQGVHAGDGAIYVGPIRKVAERGRAKKRSQDYKAHWLENTGVKPHKIRPKRAVRGVLLLHGGRFYSQVQHPGIRKNQFIRRGFDIGAPKFQPGFDRGLSRFLERQRARYNS